MECKDCGRKIDAEENERNGGKCDRCAIGDCYAYLRGSFSKNKLANYKRTN